MNNQFDERLSGKIRDVFDNYEDNLADEGWKKLREKYPAKTERSPFIYWISSAAAAVLLAFGIWTFKPSVIEGDGKTIAEVNRKVDSTAENLTDFKKSEDEFFEQAESIANNDKTLRNTQIAKPEAKTSKPVAETAASKGSKQTTKVENANRYDKIEGASVASLKAETKAASIPDQSAAVQEDQENTNFKKDEVSPVVASAALTPEEASSASMEKDGKLSNVSVVANNITPDQVVNSSTETLVKIPKTIPVNSIASAGVPVEKPSLLNIKEDKERVLKSRDEQKVTFGIYAGSFVNYSEGSENKLNIGAGFSSDIALTKTLRFSTGLGISRNELSFDRGSFPQTPSLLSSNAFDKSEIQTGIISNAPYYNLSTYSASLLGVDIPTNLKLVLPKRKDELFVSAGISSGAFLNEKYNYQYQNVNPLAESVDVQKKTDEKKQAGFGNFEFARTLNFSFGVGYPIGKQNRIVIEPFLRYPLRDMGQENLRFGSGGLNLKLNFESNKK